MTVLQRKRSPLRVAPLRVPGQSLEEQRDWLAIRKIGFWIMMPLTFWLLAFVHWWQWYRQAPPQPILNIIVAVIVTIVALVKVPRLMRRLDAVAQGIQGERYVGQQLEQLRARGFRVIHDLCSDHFNIDHVLIGPEGVFTIETKTFSKPNDGECKIIYDGNSIHVPGCRLDRDPLAQARAAAAHVARILRENTGRDVFVRPVVIFAGWYVEKTARSPAVWVLNENHLEAYLDHEERSLPPEDIEWYTARLAEHVRKNG